MGFVEDGNPVELFERPLTFTYDRSLRKGKGGFYFVFDEGALRCSHADDFGEICMVSPNEINIVTGRSNRFVYLDCGAWVDNADGKGTKRRDFGLICGSHVYLCEFTGQAGPAPETRVPSVRKLFLDFKDNGCNVRVIKHIDARDYLPMEPAIADSRDLYLFLPDLHMPPVSWFYTRNELSALMATRTPPSLIADTPVFKRQNDWLYRNYYSFAQLERESGRKRIARGPITGCPDIFQLAGDDLVTFLRGVTNLKSDVKGLLHFIQVGDLFELWLGRDYQFDSESANPNFISGGVDNAANWALEVMIHNSPVFEAFRALERAGLSEVQYIWGNHDSYLMFPDVARQLDVPPRTAVYQGLSGRLFVEHGHRFDAANYDSGLISGPTWANRAYLVPAIRSAEPVGRNFMSIMGSPDQVDAHLMGASLVFLTQKFDEKKTPFGIYVMGHTHARKLFVFNIKTQYHLYPQTGPLRRQVAQ